MMKRIGCPRLREPSAAQGGVEAVDGASDGAA